MSVLADVNGLTMGAFFEGPPDYETGGVESRHAWNGLAVGEGNIYSPCELLPITAVMGITLEARLATGPVSPDMA